MSSFILDRQQFANLEENFIKLFDKDNYILDYSDWSDKANFKQILKNRFAELRNINVLCVCLQYAHHYGDQLNNEIKENMEHLNSLPKAQFLTLVDVYKQFKSLNYQIEIEHLSDTRDLTESEADALEFLQNAINGLARNFIENSVAFAKSEHW